MKTSVLLLTLTSVAAAAPTTYGPPEGGWESIDWSKIDYPDDAGKDAVPEGGWDSIDWSKVDYSNVDWSKIDWSKVDYPQGTGSSSSDGKPTPAYSFFTSTYSVQATPEEVVNGTSPTGGLAGSRSSFWLGIRRDANLICYDISLTGFKGDYQSPAVTATHIHEAARGSSGPPRIVFPDPVGNDDDDDVRRSVGCLTGPFTTGVVNGGKDAGEGFNVAMIEDNPAAFYVDIHSSEAVPGAVRGQMG